jgi:nicotinate-nucleotide adenylyltransferase
MRLGIFGGSFDPPHIGHFLAAVDAVEQLGLDCLFWVPAAQQPLKTDAPHEATMEQRYSMVAAATAVHPIFTPSRIEMDRGGLSYTVTTIEAFTQDNPGAEIFLLVGQDSWDRFSDWHHPQRIRTLAQIVVLARPVLSQSTQSAPDRWLQSRVVDVSSTEIRARVRAGHTIRGFVQDAVADIIESEHMYRW